MQTAETFLLGVPLRRSGKGTVLIAIALLHFPTGLDRISTAAFAFLKGRPETAADAGNSGPHKEETGGPERQTRGCAMRYDCPQPHRGKRGAGGVRETRRKRRGEQEQY